MAKKDSSNKEHAADFGVDVAGGGAIFTAASITRAIGTLLLLVVLARLLKPADYGLYVLVIAFASLLGLNTDFGVGNALKKKLPEAKTNERVLGLINNAYFGAVVIALVIAIGGVIFSNYVAANIYKNALLTGPIIIAFIAIIFGTLFTVTISSLLGLRKSKEAGIGYITYSLTQLILSSILVILGYGVTGALIGLLLSFIIGFLVVFGLLIKHIRYTFAKPSKKMLTELFGFSTPIFMSNIINSGTQNLGVILLGIFATSVIVGNYGAAFKLASFGDVIIIACAQVLLPAYSHMIYNKKSSKKLESIYNSSIYYTLLLLLPLLAYLVSVSKAVIFIFLSSIYTVAPLYFSIIATGIITGIIYRYGAQMIVGYGKIKIYTFYVVTVSVLLIILLLLLTPLLKVYGVLLTLFVIGPILFDLAFLRFMSKELHIKFHWSKPLRVFLASLILLLPLTYMSMIIVQGRYLVLINAVITLVLYPPLLTIFKGVNDNDIKFVNKVANKIGVNFIMKYLLIYTDIFIKR